MTKILNILLKKLINNKVAYLPFFLLFMSCAKDKDVKISDIQNFSVIKKEHKVELLRSQISNNQILMEETRKKTEQLKEDLFCLQITKIRKKIDKLKSMSFKIKQDKALYNEFISNYNSSLFFEERKTLTKIIAESTKHSHKAQIVLDDILECITNLNDNNKL